MTLQESPLIEYTLKQSNDLQACYHLSDAIKKRLIASDEVGTALVNIDATLKNILKHREEFLYYHPDISISNLSTLKYNPSIKEGCIQLRLDGGIIVKVKVDEKVEILYKNALISEPETLSVNKQNNGAQILQFASEDEIWLHKAVKAYKEIKALYKYQVGHVVNIHPFVGIYKITEIDSKMRVTITCKKWLREGRNPVRINYSDIKGFADTKSYNTNFLKNRNKL